jgi:capsular polysaccharide transport system permease protein
MATSPSVPPSGFGSLAAGFITQMRVIGALLMREIHTRYGRENIGYLWLIAEPMMLASVIGALHSSGHTEYGSDVKPLPFTVLGYTTFIMFRGIVNRAEGAIEVNAPLLYHRMVTITDIVVSRALLEAAGTTITYIAMIIFLTGLGLAAPPVRPLFYLAALGAMFLISLGHSLIIAGISHDNRTVGRLVHPYSYFMIPLSGAFFQAEWIPEPYRSWLMILPLPHIFELARYGQFRSANLKYFDGPYLIGWCLLLIWIGLVTVKITRKHVHLS